MITENNTKSVARAIGLVRAQFTHPRVMPAMSRQEFDEFFRNLSGALSNESQVVGREKLEGDEDFLLVEYFLTQNGPLVAAHLLDQTSIIVVINGEAA